MMRKVEKWKRAGVVMLGVGICALAMSEPAFAAGGAGGGITKVLQNIVDVLQGDAARLLGIIAVIVVGVGWAFGRIDMRTAGGTVVGLAVVFGATEIVDMLMS